MTAALVLLTAAVVGAITGMWVWAAVTAWRKRDTDRWAGD